MCVPGRRGRGERERGKKRGKREGERGRGEKEGEKKERKREGDKGTGRGRERGLREQMLWSHVYTFTAIFLPAVLV